MVNEKKILKEEVGLITVRDNRTKILYEEEKSSSNGCGLGEFFRPKWLQNFATPKTFMTVYGLLGTIQAMSYVFMVTTLTTLERRFGIPSQTTGIILSGNEISQILFSLFLSYTGGHRNRPVWLGWGVAFSAASCFVLALPHFIYGPGDQAISLTKEYVDKYGVNETSLKIKEQMGLCSEQRSAKECNSGSYSIVPPLLIFLSQFILGIGTTLSYALGQTYIDDNTKKTNTPMVFGLTLALRTIGPTIGFFVSYLCLSLYVDPSLTPLIDKKDPRWVGAWWLGWLIMGSVMLIFAFLIAMFPKKLPPSKNKIHDQANNKEIEAEIPEKGPPPLKDFPAALKRLIKNKLLVINIFSGIFYIIGSSGYIIYLNKYIEVQFNKSTANATVIIGPAVLISMVFAFLGSGYVISKFKPGPKYLLSWNVIAGMVVVMGEITMMFVSCEDTNLVGYNVLERKIDVMNSCNVDCACENLKYAPVCFEEQKLTFYSACHAGCKTTYRSDKTKAFSNCTCIPSLNSYQASEGILKEGSCKTECGYNFQLYIILVSVVNFLASSGKIGNILVNYRAVLPEDKAFAQGFGLLLISLLAFIPGPILFGSIIDATCLIWDSDCGEKGNCWFYDRHAFRVNLNFTAFGLTSIGVILDAIVCYLGKDLVLYEEEEKPKNENGQIKTSSM